MTPERLRRERDELVGYVAALKRDLANSEATLHGYEDVLVRTGEWRPKMVKGDVSIKLPRPETLRSILEQLAEAKQEGERMAAALQKIADMWGITEVTHQSIAAEMRDIARAALTTADEESK
jgi:transposase